MDTPINNTGFGATNATDSGTSRSQGGAVCDHCGKPINRGLDEFLGKLGVSDDAIRQLKGQLQNVDIEEYLNTARDYLKGGSNKATQFAKDNPGKVAAGVAVLGVGVGLLISALNRD